MPKLIDTTVLPPSRERKPMNIEEIRNLAKTKLQPPTPESIAKAKAQKQAQIDLMRQMWEVGEVNVTEREINQMLLQAQRDLENIEQNMWKEYEEATKI